MSTLFHEKLDPLAVRALLTASRDGIRRPECWVQGYAAVNEHGNEVSPTASSACRYCSFGSVLKHDPGATVAVNDDDESGLGPLGQAAFRFLNHAALRLGFVPAASGEPMVLLNDNGRHADVLRAFSWAIAMVGDKGLAHYLWNRPR